MGGPYGGSRDGARGRGRRGEGDRGRFDGTNPRGGQGGILQDSGDRGEPIARQHGRWGAQHVASGGRSTHGIGGDLARQRGFESAHRGAGLELGGDGLLDGGDDFHGEEQRGQRRSGESAGLRGPRAGRARG